MLETVFEKRGFNSNVVFKLKLSFSFLSQAQKDGFWNLNFILQ